MQNKTGTRNQIYSDSCAADTPVEDSLWADYNRKRIIRPKRFFLACLSDVHFAKWSPNTDHQKLGTQTGHLRVLIDGERRHSQISAIVWNSDRRKLGKARQQVFNKCSVSLPQWTIITHLPFIAIYAICWNCSIQRTKKRLSKYLTQFPLNPYLFIEFIKFIKFILNVFLF